MSRVDATPYPWPWDGNLHPARLALLVLAAPGQPAADTAERADGTGTPRLRQVRTAIQGLATELAADGVLVTQVTCAVPRGRDRTPLRPALRPALETAGQHVASCGIDGFFGSPLDQLLRAERRDLLLLCGTWLETSVHSTMRSANDRGYECLLLTDLTVPADPALAGGALSSIQMSGGIFGACAGSDAVRRGIAGTAAGTIARGTHP